MPAEPTADLAIHTPNKLESQVKPMEATIHLTPIKDTLSDNLFISPPKGGFFRRSLGAAPSETPTLSPQDVDYARGAIDVYKMAHFEIQQRTNAHHRPESQQFSGGDMKIVDSVVVRNSIGDNTLSVQFKTTSHHFATDGRQFINLIQVQKSPNLDDMAPIYKKRGHVIAKRAEEHQFTMFGLLGDLETRYGESKVMAHFKEDQYQDIALVVLTDFDRLVDTTLTISPDGLTVSKQTATSVQTI